MIQLKLITDDMEIYERENRISQYSEQSFFGFWAECREKKIRCLSEMKPALSLSER